jgi:hypothetical protein
MDKYRKFYKIHGAKKILYTFGGKDNAGHWFHFVLRLMKSGAEMSSVTAICETTDIFRKQFYISVTLPEICCIVYLLSL